MTTARTDGWRLSLVVLLTEHDGTSPWHYDVCATPAASTCWLIQAIAEVVIDAGKLGVGLPQSEVRPQWAV
jgi:hypothetical protein